MNVLVAELGAPSRCSPEKSAGAHASEVQCERVRTRKRSHNEAGRKSKQPGGGNFESRKKRKLERELFGS